LPLCTGRASGSSNLRSVILVLRPRDATVEASLVQQHLDVAPRLPLPRAPDDCPVGRARQTIAAAQDGERRERVELGYQRPQPKARAIAAPRERGGEP